NCRRFLMRKVLSSLAAAGAIAAATVAVPSQANAFAPWVVPVIIAAGVGGLAVGATAANANAYGPRGDVYVQPRAAAVSNCHIVRERTANGFRRIEVCD